MKLKKVTEKKQPKNEKLSLVVEEGTTETLARLKAAFETEGYVWDFDKRVNRWLKNFTEEADKALKAHTGTTVMAGSEVAGTAQATP